jgi:hypothetical protein
MAQWLYPAFLTITFAVILLGIFPPKTLRGAKSYRVKQIQKGIGVALLIIGMLVLFFGSLPERIRLLITSYLGVS